MDLSKAIAFCRPGASWSLAGNEYSGLQWHDIKQPKPTLEELQAAWHDLNNPPKPELFTTVTMGALRLALGRDLCIQVGAWIQGIQDTTQKFQAQTWWEYSPTVRSNHPVVEQFRVALNKTPEEVAAYFSAAYAIDNT